MVVRVQKMSPVMRIGLIALACLPIWVIANLIGFGKQWGAVEGILFLVAVPTLAIYGAYKLLQKRRRRQPQE